MYLCVCNSITEEDFQKELSTHSGRASELCRRLGVGQDCGACFKSALDYCQKIKRRDKVSNSHSQSQSKTAKNIQ